MTAGAAGTPYDRSSRWVTRSALGIGLLAGSWSALRDERLQRLDVRAGDAVRRAGSADLERAVALTTDLGSVYSVIGIAAALALTGRRRAAADVACVGALAWNIAQVSKTRVRRLRPYEREGVRRLVRPPTGSSFPSGHAAVGTAVMTVLAESARRRRARDLLYGVGAYVAWSRVFVGVHYPTDVLGGAGLGLTLGSLWRGPFAATGRRLFAAGIAVGRALLPRPPRSPRGLRARRRGRAPAGQTEARPEAA